MSQSKGKSERSRSVTLAVSKDLTVRMMRLFWGGCQNQAVHCVNQVISCKSNGGLRRQFCSLSGCIGAKGLLQTVEEGTGEKFF